MRSQLIEFFRFADLRRGQLSGDVSYLRARGGEPVEEVVIPVEHEVFLQRLGQLRYPARTTEADRLEALDWLAKVVTDALGTCDSPDEPLQIDLVTNAAELSALPFELAVDGSGRPIFAVSDPPLVLTRRLRAGSPGERPVWWSSPRVLFAVASPASAGERVELDEHRMALRAALRPWSEPLPGMPEPIGDDRKVLTTITEAGPAAIRAKIEEASRDGRPFTHLHILAHGRPLGDGRFGIAMYAADGTTMINVTPEHLRDQLGPVTGDLVVATLAVCDGGNEAGSTTGGVSVAHLLHEAGIPVVVAAQLPLTFEGAVVFTRTFYKGLLNGTDVRLALHETRAELHGVPAARHDWASLVAYVRLPDDYQSRRREVHLEAEMASLRTVQEWADSVAVGDDPRGRRFAEVKERLVDRINVLESSVVDLPPGPVRNENLGLLGSAHKRLAELYFRGDLTADAAEALHAARDWYEQGYSGNLSHHWAGVQWLSLEAVLVGRIDRVDRWHAAREAARTDSGAWPLGTLAELCLLAPLVGRDRALDEAESYLARLITWPDSERAVDATRRQLARYVRWWTTANGYFVGGPDLSADAARLLARFATP